MDIGLRKYLNVKLSELESAPSPKGPTSLLRYLSHKLDEHGVQVVANRKLSAGALTGAWFWYMPENGDGTEGTQTFETQDLAWTDAAMKLVHIEDDVAANPAGYHYLKRVPGGLRVQWSSGKPCDLTFTVAWSALAGRSKIGLVHALKDALKDHGVTFDNEARTWSIADQTYGPFEAIWAMMLDVSQYVQVIGADGVKRPMGIGPDGNLALPAECDPVPLAGTIKQAPLLTDAEMAESSIVYNVHHAVQLSRQLDELLGTEYRPGDELHQAGRLIRKLVKGTSKTKPALEQTTGLSSMTGLSLGKVQESLTALKGFNSGDERFERVDGDDLKVAQLALETVEWSLNVSVDMLINEANVEIDDLSIRRMIRHMQGHGTKAGDLCAAMLAQLQRQRIEYRKPEPVEPQFTERQRNALAALIESFERTGASEVLGSIKPVK